MNQKKAKLLNKFLKITGQDNTGEQWKTIIGMNKGKPEYRFNTLRDDKRIKRAYKDSNYKQKSAMSIIMLSVIKKYDQTKKT